MRVRVRVRLRLRIRVSRSERKLELSWQPYAAVLQPYAAILQPCAQPSCSSVTHPATLPGEGRRNGKDRENQKTWRQQRGGGAPRTRGGANATTFVFGSNPNP